jgi:AcrR family transcriptional regulator
VTPAPPAPVPVLAPKEPLRRLPRQRRARERVQRLLDAADRLLAEQGAEALGTKQVAAAAGVSIGSLYFWFPDKEAIAEALAHRYWSELGELVAGVAGAAHAEVEDDLVGVTLGALAAGFRARPGFLALWFGGLRSERIREAMRPYRGEVASAIEQLLLGRYPHLDPDQRRTTAQMVVLLGDAILGEAFRIDRQGDTTVLAEGTRALRAYILDRLKEPT